METYDITDEEFVYAVHAIVESNPDFVYEPPQPPGSSGWSARCLYAHGGAPSCLIGQALHRVGVPVYVLEDLDNLSSDSGGTAANVMLNILSPKGISNGVRHWAGHVQALQDTGTPWGEALATANRSYPGVANL